jgi:hypothetical protein
MIIMANDLNVHDHDNEHHDDVDDQQINMNITMMIIKMCQRLRGLAVQVFSGGEEGPGSMARISQRASLFCAACSHTKWPNKEEFRIGYWEMLFGFR